MKNRLPISSKNQVVAGILIEGVTGAGKTQTLRALKDQNEFPALLGSGCIFDEDETFGEVMAETQEPGVFGDFRIIYAIQDKELNRPDCEDRQPQGSL